MTTTIEYNVCGTFKTKCGTGRITYHPEWSEDRPWISYVRGTAGAHFKTPESAQLFFKLYHNLELDLEKYIP